VTAGGEGVGDGGVRSEETLGRSGRSKPLHLALSSSDRDVRALRPAVLALALDVLRAEAQLTHRGTVGPQPVGHQLLRHYALLLQQHTHQS
jgi:hypothetical protein